MTHGAWTLEVIHHIMHYKSFLIRKSVRFLLSLDLTADLPTCCRKGHMARGYDLTVLPCWSERPQCATPTLSDGPCEHMHEKWYLHKGPQHSSDGLGQCTCAQWVRSWNRCEMLHFISCKGLISYRNFALYINDSFESLTVWRDELAQTQSPSPLLHISLTLESSAICGALHVALSGTAIYRRSKDRVTWGIISLFCSIFGHWINKSCQCLSSVDAIFLHSE